jgi:hypothetical protein
MYKFPVYDKGTEQKIKNVFVDIIIDKPIDSTEELYNYLMHTKLIEKTDVILTIDSIIDSINNNKMYKDLFNNSEIHSHNTSTKFNIMKAFNKIPDSFKYNYDKLKNEAIKELENSFKKSCYWIHDNKLEVIEFLNDSKNRALMEYKNKKSEYNKTYKDKLKVELQIKDKIILTDEQRKINKQLAQKKYKDKLKVELQIKDKIILTDEQRKINKQISNKIYRDKLKLNLQIKDKIILTDEQQKINRKITQKKYRDKVAVALHQAEELGPNVNPN